MYALFLGHLILPAVGVPFDSATLIGLFAELPLWAKLSAKTIVTFPAAFHTFNGLRHLGWDMGYCKFSIPSLDSRKVRGNGTDEREIVLKLKDSYTAGWSVIAVSVVSTAAVVAM